MPQHTQHSLIHVLLLWTTILSIVQVAFIIYFFTAEHRGLSQNSIADKQTMKYKANNTSSFSSEKDLLLGKGKMLIFLATQDDNSTTWVAKNPDTDLISEKGKVLTIMKDGYYFLSLQVTPASCKENYTVSLKWKSNILLQGRTNSKSCSTGLLGKVVEFIAGGTLEVIISPRADINTSEYLTYLDIIYMHKP